MIDGSSDGTHKLSIDISGLIYDWNNDGWWNSIIYPLTSIDISIHWY